MFMNRYFTFHIEITQCQNLEYALIHFKIMIMHVYVCRALPYVVIWKLKTWFLVFGY